MTVYKKLIEVQKELKAPKSKKNNFGNYMYRSCEDILEALKPVLSEHGATVFISDKPVVKENLWSYIEATATFVDTESGDSVSVTAYAREAEQKKEQEYGHCTLRTADGHSRLTSNQRLHRRMAGMAGDVYHSCFRDGAGCQHAADDALYHLLLFHGWLCLCGRGIERQVLRCRE